MTNITKEELNKIIRCEYEQGNSMIVFINGGGTSVIGGEENLEYLIKSIKSDEYDDPFIVSYEDDIVHGDLKWTVNKLCVERKRVAIIKHNGGYNCENMEIQIMLND